MTGLLLAHMPVSPTVGTVILASVCLALGAGLGAYMTVPLAHDARARCERLRSALRIIARHGDEPSSLSARNALTIDAERDRR